jgi:hypothetical protein
VKEAERMPERRLVMNPHVHVLAQPQPRTLPIDVSAIETITVECPVRGRGLVTRVLRRESDEELFGFFSHLIEREGRAELGSDASVLPRLREIGFLIFSDEAVEWPRFRVGLDSVPLRDLPPLQSGGPRRVSADLLFQREFSLHPGMAWPEEYARQTGWLDCFAKGPAVWVPSPLNGVLTPFWLDGEAAEWAERLVPGGEAPDGLPEALAARLIAIGALVPAKEPVGLEPPHATDAFRERRYVIARDLVHPFELSALREYTAALLREGLLSFGDRQVSRRFGRYNEPISRFLQTRLTPLMSAVAGRALVPTFSFLFCYASGAELTPHIDRREAEYSISLQVDYAPEPSPDAATPWPLGFQLADGTTVLTDLRLGDAVLYHGAELVHFRAPLPEGHRSAQLILEYVPADFESPRI